MQSLIYPHKKEFVDSAWFKSTAFASLRLVVVLDVVHREVSGAAADITHS